MTGIATLSTTPLKYSPTILEWDIRRQYGDAYWQADITCGEAVSLDLLEYFRDFYIIETDHQNKERLVFLGTCPGVSYIEKVTGDRTIIHAFSHDWILSKQKVQDERLSTVVFDEVTDSYYYKRPDDDLIPWLVGGEEGNYLEESGINPRGILQIGEYGDVSTPSTAIPVRPFIFSKDTWKIEAIRSVEQYLNGIFDCRWHYPDVTEAGKIDLETMITEPTAFFCGVGNLDLAFNLDGFITMPDPASILKTDPFVDGELQSEDLIDEQPTRVIVWGTMAYFAVHFTGLSPALTNSEIQTADWPFVNEGTFYSGDGVSATVVDCSMDYSAGGYQHKSSTAGTVIVSWDMGYGYETPLDFQIGATIVSASHTATVDCFGIYDAAVEIYKKVIDSPALQAKTKRHIDYFEDMEQTGNTRAKVEKRAIELSEFLFLPKKTYRLSLKRRVDLRYLQSLKLFGYDTVSSSNWLRIIGINYRKTGNDVSVDVDLVEDAVWVKRKSLFREFSNSYEADLQRLIDARVKALSKNEGAATVKKVSGSNFVVAETLDGTTITKQVL